MKAEPVSEHAFLQKLIGDWEMRHETEEGSGLVWRESVRSLQGNWIVAEGEGETPEGDLASSLMVLGYDPGKGHYVGTWIGSMMQYLWVYKGTMDESGTELTLEAEGPAFDGSGGTALYRDVVILTEDGRRRFRSLVREADGGWKQFMTAEYDRL